MPELLLPDPLAGPHGESVRNALDWRQTVRPVLLKNISHNMFGDIPENAGPVHFEAEESDIDFDGRAIRSTIQISFWGVFGFCKFKMQVFIPQNATTPVPVFLYLYSGDLDSMLAHRSSRSSEEFPLEMLIEKGYAAAVLFLRDLATDVDPNTVSNQLKNKNGFVNALYGNNILPKHACGTLGIWAWAAGRAIDYFEKERRIHPQKISVLGQARSGISSLWCGAKDERVALTLASQTDTCFPDLFRQQSANIESINQKHPNWFCGNFHQYTRNNLPPFDMHQLLALMVPRLIYISYSRDHTDPMVGRESQAALHANPVYEMSGKKGLDSDYIPLPNTKEHSGSIGFHLRSGEPGLTHWDWERFLEFADLNFKDIP